MTTRRLTVVFFTCIALLAAGCGGTGTGSGTEVRAGARPAAPAPQPLRILVTNDDGIGAAGIDAVVEALRKLPNVQITVIAPATNQSGTGDRFTTTPITTAAATTVSGFAGTAVNGFPADSVLLGLQKLLPRKPHLVVSGINQGQNIAELAAISGTVGAARWAARLGVPAVAVSQGLATPIDYQYAAKLTANLIQLTRSSLFKKPVVELTNINVPTCATVRGVRVVPLGLSTRVTGYNQTATSTYAPIVNRRDLFAVNCASTKTNVVDDVDAFTNGFASVTTLDIDGTAD
jgi:5'-nucleotidase